jgi:hypothetical protein
MKIKLAEVKMILDNKEQELRDIYAERIRSIRDTFKLEAGVETKINPDYEFGVDDLTSKINALEREILELKSILTTTNCNTLVEYTIDKQAISLHKAIVLVKQYREGINNIKSLGEQKETRRTVNEVSNRFTPMGNSVASYEEITRPTYNTKLYRDMYQKRLTLITKLEMAINQANYTTNVEIPDFIKVASVD